MQSAFEIWQVAPTIIPVAAKILDASKKWVGEVALWTANLLCGRSRGHTRAFCHLCRTDDVVIEDVIVIE